MDFCLHAMSSDDFTSQNCNITFEGNVRYNFQKLYIANIE